MRNCATTMKRGGTSTNYPSQGGKSSLPESVPFSRAECELSKVELGEHTTDCDEPPRWWRGAHPSQPTCWPTGRGAEGASALKDTGLLLPTVMAMYESHDSNASPCLGRVEVYVPSTTDVEHLILISGSRVLDQTGPRCFSSSRFATDQWDASNPSAKWLACP